MTFAAMNDVEDSTLPAPMRQVALVYGDEADNDGSGWPLNADALAIDHICKRTGLSPETVGSSITALVLNGWLHPVRPALVYEPPRPARRLRMRDRRGQIAPRVVLIVFRRDGFRCRACGRAGGDLTIDHVVPLALGGADELANLQTMCKSCNSKKGARVF